MHPDSIFLDIYTRKQDKNPKKIIFCSVHRILYIYIYINRIHNKSFRLLNICVYTVYIYYVNINTNTSMYIFLKIYVMFIY